MSAEVTFTVAATPDSPPTLDNPQAAFTSQPSSNGGEVVLRINAADDLGVSKVRVEITKPDNGKVSFDLPRISGNATTGTYQITYNAPANLTTHEQPYSVQFTVMDNANQSGTPMNAQFAVPACATPFSLTSASLSINNLPSTGGNVTITATLNGCQGAVNLTATIKTGSGKKAKIVANMALSQQSGNTYTTAWNAPANTTKKNVTYNVSVSLNNGTPVNAGAVTVAKKSKKSGKNQSVLDDDEDAPKIGAASSLHVRLLNTVKVGNNATLVTFTLNKPARVTARVLSPTGKAVREFNVPQARAGLNALTWDSKSQSGGVTQRSVYLIEIVARAEEGQATRAVTAVTVR
jgi:hypothetical protein